MDEEMMKKCRCWDCAIHKTNHLSGDPFCLNGTNETAKAWPEEGPCECQGCPIREAPHVYEAARKAAEAMGQTLPELELGLPKITGVLYCKRENGYKEDEMPEKEPVRVDAHVTLGPMNASAGATEMVEPKKEDEGEE